MPLRCYKGSKSLKEMPGSALLLAFEIYLCAEYICAWVAHFHLRRVCNKLCRRHVPVPARGRLHSPVRFVSNSHGVI